MEVLHPVTVSKAIRKLSGRSKAHLVEADDGHYYVVKALYSTEQVRIAAEEWLVSEILQLFGIATPPITPINVSASSDCRDHEQLAKAPRHWPHFASRVPVNPFKNSIFDILPRPLLPKVQNAEDFWKVAVIDTLTDKASVRQGIFFRNSDTHFLHAHFIDHKCHLLALSPDYLGNFESTFAARVLRECPTISINLFAFNTFLAELSDSCWRIFLENSQPIPDAWLEHISEAELHRSLRYLWKRFSGIESPNVDRIFQRVKD